jgi:hypothetical protein
MQRIKSQMLTAEDRLRAALVKALHDELEEYLAGLAMRRPGESRARH